MSEQEIIPPTKKRGRPPSTEPGKVIRSTINKDPSTAVAIQEPGDFGSLIARFIKDPSVDPQKLRELADLQLMVMAKDSEGAFNIAMRQVQNEIHPIVRKMVNKHTQSKFAKLEQIDKEIRPIYTKHGFSLTSTSAPGRDGAVKIITTCLHDKGHSRDYELEGDLDTAGAKGADNKTKIQGLGSSVSYLRRYLTCLIFNVVLTDEDNDGNKTIIDPLPDDKYMKLQDWLAGVGEDGTKALLDFMGLQTCADINTGNYVKAINFLKQYAGAAA